MATAVPADALGCHSLEWSVPPLESAVVALEPAVAQRLSTAQLREHEMGVLLSDEDGACEASTTHAHVCGKAPLDKAVLARAGVDPRLVQLSAPFTQVVAKLVRDGIEHCLASARMYRVGDFYLSAEQLSSTRAEPQGRGKQRLKAMTAVRCVVHVAATAACSPHAPFRARAEFAETIVRFRQQQPDSPLVLRVLLPHLRKRLDSTGFCNLMEHADDYEAACERAVALLLPSETRVTILCLATERRTLDAFLARALELAAAQEDVEVRAGLPPAALAPLEDVALWALVRRIDPTLPASADALYADIEARVFGLGLDGGAQQGAADASANPLHRAFVLNGIQLFDAVGVVPSVARVDPGGDLPPAHASAAAVRAPAQLCALAARDRVRAALDEAGGGKLPVAPFLTPDGGAMPHASMRLVALCVQDGKCRPLAATKARLPAGSCEDDAESAHERDERARQREQEHDFREILNDEELLDTPATGTQRLEQLATHADDSGQSDEPRKRRVFVTAAALLERASAADGGNGGQLVNSMGAATRPHAEKPNALPAPCTQCQPSAQSAKTITKGACIDSHPKRAKRMMAPAPLHARAAGEVLDAAGALTAAGAATIDAVFDQCDLDGDAILCKADLDHFQKHTGGEPLDDDDLDSFCAQFDSVSAPLRGITRAGFRAYFAAAFAEDKDAAFADLKAFDVVEGA
jgi:hypothetical protein